MSDDLRSIGQANEIVALVGPENDFDELFTGLYHPRQKSSDTNSRCN